MPSLASLQAALPEPMRQPRFAPSSLPPKYVGAIRHGGPGQEVNLSPLPVRMRQEMAWCLFRIIEIGGTVAVPAVNMLARPARRGRRRLREQPRRPGAGVAAGLPGP